MFRLGDGLLAEPDGLRALTGWMRAVARHAAAYQGLASMLADGAANERSELHESCVRMADFTDRLTARAGRGSPPPGRHRGRHNRAHQRGRLDRGTNVSGISRPIARPRLHRTAPALGLSA